MLAGMMRKSRALLLKPAGAAGEQCRVIVREVIRGHGLTPSHFVRPGKTP